MVAFETLLLSNFISQLDQFENITEDQRRNFLAGFPRCLPFGRIVRLA